MLSLDFITNDYQDKKTYSENVEEQIKIDILTGKMRANSSIIENKLCEKYTLSRTPIREILSRLQAEGFVNLLPNRGFFVREFTKEDFNDVASLRCTLYPQAVKYAIQRITIDELKMLKETFKFMEFYTKTADYHKMQRIYHGFDAISYNATHNKDIESLLLKLDFISQYSQNEVQLPMNYHEVLLSEYRDIFDAFIQKNSDAGYEAAEIHAYKQLMRGK